MPLSLFTLILASALIHVVAHVALKRARDRTAFVWWMLFWGAVLFAPVVILIRMPIPPIGWVFIGLTSVFESLYFASIAKAYQTGDLSLVYPLARGAAPAFLLLWSAAALGERPSLPGVLGILAIAGGLYVISLPRLAAWREPLRGLQTAGPRWALFAGACISLYTAVDKVGVEFMDPLLYLYLGVVLTVIWLAPWALATVGARGLWAELRSSRLASVLAGFTTMAAYTLVLIAMRAGAPASYAGAVREISVVFGVGIGVLVLKESGAAMRLGGSLLVAGGVAAIGLWG
jgi:drug/metabolite transporter (DMT)-like permease